VILTPLSLALAVLLHAQAIPAIPAIPVLAVSANSAGLAFTDITAGCGLECTLTSGTTPSTQILEVKGGGLALIDFDNDGDLDVFVPNGATLADPEHGPGARMFRNDGAMHFSDVTASSAIKHHRWSFGVTVGDVDADGFDDIFIACFGPDVLLRNKGNGTFEDITARSRTSPRDRVFTMTVGEPAPRSPTSTSTAISIFSSATTSTSIAQIRVHPQHSRAFR